MKRILYILLLLGLLTACRKDPVVSTIDYRIKYTGNFKFTVIGEYWQGGATTWYDTVVYNGTISRYAGDTSTYYNPATAKDQMITINFLQNTIITPEINTNGELVEFTFAHYHHAGRFLDTNHIELVVDRLGGLGAGYNYYIRGQRQ